MAHIIRNNSRKIRKFELHPAAKAAIDFFHSIPPQFHFLPNEIRKFISYHNIIRGVIVDERFVRLLIGHGAESPICLSTMTMTVRWCRDR